MCLSAVSVQYDPPKPDEQVAYKVFYEEHGKLYTPWVNALVPVGRWQRAKGEDSYMLANGYHYGFHVFKTRKDASEYALHAFTLSRMFSAVVRRVLIRKVRTAGYEFVYQGGKEHRLTVLVADQLLVPKIAKEKNNDRKKTARKSPR